MRFFVDQDVYAVTVNKLRELGHDVVTAKETSRILVTRDKDFGMLIFLKEGLATGVIFLRITPRSVESAHRELNRLFNEHTEEELMHLFCVVEPNRHRIRQLPD